ncbi:MAG: ferritin-like domain-containing protein, partial [Candidatus Dechloromonas phosphoritropha]
MTRSLFAALAAALATTEIGQKLALTATVATDWQAGILDWQDTTPVDLVCGRPPRPELVPPRQVPQRGAKSPEGRARLLHAIVHIEYSAINLALDHAARFRGMPRQYYADWIGVAAEEAHHFPILRQRLRELGHDYGDFAAHAGLWDRAEKTTGDVLAR